MANEGNKVTKHWLSELPFTRINYFLFLAGLFVIVLGYILMGTGAHEPAPNRACGGASGP